jgi:DNA polymerase I-like protein with 3'-5' exonuclease and polymerase domains
MIVRSIPEWKTALKAIRASRDPIEGIPIHSYDTETRDKGFPDIHAVGFSMAWYKYDARAKLFSKDGCYVPIGHNTGEMQLPAGAIRDDLAELLEGSEYRTVMHNAPYDILVSRTFDPMIEVHDNIDDTMVMAWLLNTNGVGSITQIESGNGLKGLKDLALFYFGHKMQELVDLAPREFNPKTGDNDVLRVDLVPIAKLGPYAWDDGIQTLKLREMFWHGYEAYERKYPDEVRRLSDKYRRLLADVMRGMENLPKIRKWYESGEREFAFCLTDMNEFGVSLDVAAIEEMRGPVEVERRALGGKMFAARPGQDFDPIADKELVRKCAKEYQRLCDRYELPQGHPEYPTRVKEVYEGRGKERKLVETVREPLPVGGARKSLFAAHGLDGTAAEQKIRDAAMRPFIIENPELVHKVFNLNSQPQLADVFFKEAECPILGLTESGMPSTAGDYIEEWAALGYPVAREMLRYREIDKLYGTYMVGMPKKVGADGRMRTRFGRVRTGRLSSSDPNLQNIPTSSEFPIRIAFVAHGVLQSTYEIQSWHMDDDGNPMRPNRVKVVAEPGNSEGFDGGWVVEDGRVVEWWGKNPPWVMMVADYSQLEICLLAHISQDPILIDAVRGGQDVHALTARAVFDEIPKDLSLADVKRLFPKQRKNAKPVNFGVIYGMGPTALALALNISKEEAKRLIEERYMGYYKGVKLWIDGRHRFVAQFGYVELPTGRRRHLPEGTLDQNALDVAGGTDRFGRPKTNWGRVGSAKRQAQNTPIQGFAADVIGLAMRDIRRWLRSTTIQDVCAAGGVMQPSDGTVWCVTEVQKLFRTYVRMMLQVHDELVKEMHPAIANYVMDKTVELMETPGNMKLRVPLSVDAALGANWAHTKE